MDKMEELAAEIVDIFRSRYMGMLPGHETHIGFTEGEDYDRGTIALWSPSHEWLQIRFRAKKRPTIGLTVADLLGD